MHPPCSGCQYREEFVLGIPSAMSVMQIMAPNLPASLLSGCSWGCSAAHGPQGWEFGLVPTQLHRAGEPEMLFPFTTPEV